MDLSNASNVDADSWKMWKKNVDEALKKCPEHCAKYRSVIRLVTHNWYLLATKSPHINNVLPQHPCFNKKMIDTFWREKVIPLCKKAADLHLFRLQQKEKDSAMAEEGKLQKEWQTWLNEVYELFQAPSYMWGKQKNVLACG